MVLSEHFLLSFVKHTFRGQNWLLLGQHGVTIFFVLSGYLITSGLLAQERINLKKFYTRRSFRLLPAAWTFLLVLWVLNRFTPFKVIGNDLWGCLLFYRNYVTPLGEYATTQHFWSLSVEEQFYLVWPTLLVIVGRRRAVVVAAIATVSVAVFRLTHWGAYDSRYCYFGRTEMCVDKILVGCLLAFLLSNEDARAWFRQYGQRVFLGCLVPFATDIYFFRRIIPLHEGILVALMIGATVMYPTMPASRVLCAKHLRTTGLMSYSIYLWQQFLFRENWGQLAFVLLPIAAMMSWVLIEQPCIRLCARITSNNLVPE